MNNIVDILNFLSSHIFTIHLELGFVPTQQGEPERDLSNVIDMNAFNELKQECPDFVDDLEYDDRIKPRFGFR